MRYLYTHQHGTQLTSFAGSPGKEIRDADSLDTHRLRQKTRGAREQEKKSLRAAPRTGARAARCLGARGLIVRRARSMFEQTPPMSGAFHLCNCLQIKQELQGAHVITIVHKR